jgi:hypothetical protein
MGFTYISNKAAVQKQLDEAFTSMVDYYFKAIRAVVNTDRYWSGFEKNPIRDIVDKTTFRESQGQEKLGRMHHAIFWAAAHAVYVRYGGTTPNGKRFPGRAFEEVAAEEADLANFFIKAYKSGGSMQVKGVVLMSGQEV